MVEVATYIGPYVMSHMHMPWPPRKKNISRETRSKPYPIVRAREADPRPVCRSRLYPCAQRRRSYLTFSSAVLPLDMIAEIDRRHTQDLSIQPISYIMAEELVEFTLTAMMALLQVTKMTPFQCIHLFLLIKQNFRIHPLYLSPRTPETRKTHK